MKSIIFFLGYISMLGLPHALRLHSEAQGKGDELDGSPLWLVVLAELMMRAGFLLIISWILQESLGHEVFRRFQVFFLLMAFFVSGTLHTLCYYYCYGIKLGKWSKARLQLVYRLGRNLTYSVIPGFPVAGVVLIWQELNQIELFKGNVVELGFFSMWFFMMFIGIVEALFAKRMPRGLDRTTLVIHDSKKFAP